jgi:hypothetical protein
MLSPAPPDVSAALPDRPITVRPPPTIRVPSAISRFVALFVVLAGASWWLGPDVVNDWRIGRDVVEARDARIGEARCLSRFYVLKMCDIPFTRGGGAGAPTRTLWYLYLDVAEPGPIALLQARDAAEPGPEAITTNLGLAKLYHRSLTLALIVAVVVYGIVASVRIVRTGFATRSAHLRLSGQRLSPVVVALEGSFLTGLKRRRWTYTYGDAGRSESAFIELHSRTEPLYVTRDGKWALAVVGPGGGPPLLLDAGLSALDLSAEEKAGFLEDCGRALTRHHQA